VGIIFLLSLVIIRIGRVPAFQAGAFSQSCYRFNTYIGMAVAITAYGEPGGRLFGILIGFSIPVINVLAVSILIWYSKVDYGSRRRLMMTAKALFSNPLIIACVAGLLYARTGWGFAGFLENTFRLASLVTLPLALISIGGALKLKRLGGFFRLSLTAAVVKLAIYPLIGAVTLHCLAVTELPQHVAMLFFCLPASPQIYVLSSQLDSDTELASAAIVLSTIASFLSLSVALSL